ncbi:MAG: FxsA family protein [Actinomycetia bacterium]|nr:FxsA family protein [Actinomycetes bacterium]
MLVVFLLFFVVIPVLELYVGSLVVDALGFGPATLLLLVAVVLGVIVMRSAWRRRPRSTESAILMAAGILLLLPGYVSDVVGLLLLLPPVRALLRVWIGQRVARRLTSWNLTILRWDDDTGRITRTDVVPGEVVEDGPTDGRVVRGEIVPGPSDQPESRS